jgi:hypothetical protein
MVEGQIGEGQIGDIPPEFPTGCNPHVLWARLGTASWKGSGCAGINRFGIEPKRILRRKFSRFRNRNCLKRPCGGERRPATQLRNHLFRVPTLS